MNKKVSIISSMLFIIISLSIIFILSNSYFNNKSNVVLTSTSTDDSISPERIRYIDNGDGTATVFSIDLGTADVNGMTQANASFGTINSSYGDIYEYLKFRGYGFIISNNSASITSSNRVEKNANALTEYYKNKKYQYKQQHIRNVNNLTQSI